jgi:hypothetical protein
MNMAMKNCEEADKAHSRRYRQGELECDGEAQHDDRHSNAHFNEGQPHTGRSEQAGNRHD